jgi:hypothetical protein
MDINSGSPADGNIATRIGREICSNIQQTAPSGSLLAAQTDIAVLRVQEHIEKHGTYHLTPTALGELRHYW